MAVIIDAAIVDPVGSGKMRRQSREINAFVFEGFGGNQSRFALGTVLQSHRGPLQRLLVEILQAFKGAAGKKVGFHRPETSLFAGFPIGVPQFMTKELETILPGEILHFRDDHRSLSRAP